MDVIRYSRLSQRLEMAEVWSCILGGYEGPAFHEGLAHGPKVQPGAGPRHESVADSPGRTIGHVTSPMWLGRVGGGEPARPSGSVGRRGARPTFSQRILKC